MPQAHANFVFGENHSQRCLVCDARTVLVSFGGNADVDSEPFESGEYADDTPESKQGVEIPTDVFVNDEITGHFCIRCDALTSLCLNETRRMCRAKYDPDMEVSLFRQRMKDRGVDVEVSIINQRKP